MRLLGSTRACVENSSLAPRVHLSLLHACSLLKTLTAPLARRISTRRPSAAAAASVTESTAPPQVKREGKEKEKRKRTRAVTTGAPPSPSLPSTSKKKKKTLSFHLYIDVITSHPANNVTDAVFDKIGASLHTRPEHPIAIIKDAIYAYFDAAAASRGAAGPGKTAFTKFDGLHPVVPATANFDEVLVPADHVSRSPNDTYYVDDATVLRCHTSAHQAATLRSGERAFLVTGDVYRRDSIDCSHYPVFHQMEGVRVFDQAEWEAAGLPDGTALAEKELKGLLEGLAAHLFGPAAETRWVDAYFPFTHPSFELEVLFNGEWMEVLGCGVMQPAILGNAGLGGEGAPAVSAWAFGLGLERLAMCLFQIPDIRLFWSADPRFTRQFKAGSMASRFKPYSKYPPCFKDVSFWVPAAGLSENDMCEVVRGIAGDLAEAVTLIDAFTHPKTGKSSACYRIAYRSMERSLEDEEINAIQERVREALAEGKGVELR